MNIRDITLGVALFCFWTSTTVRQSMKNELLDTSHGQWNLTLAALVGKAGLRTEQGLYRTLHRWFFHGMPAISRRALPLPVHQEAVASCVSLTFLGFAGLLSAGHILSMICLRKLAFATPTGSGRPVLSPCLHQGPRPRPTQASTIHCHVRGLYTFRCTMVARGRDTHLCHAPFLSKSR